VEMLLNRIANPNLAPQRVTIPTEFVRRESNRAITPDSGETFSAALAGAGSAS
jgi:hypothetical protein